MYESESNNSGKLVKIFYGPYENFGIIGYSVNRLIGMKKLLLKNLHKVKFIKSPKINEILVQVNGEIIYNCDIRDLDFGGDGQLDENCKKVVSAVENAY
ncbi:hypothetical protein A3Q56_02302 [Intoshia linei]|uniref:Uncharacterized protein n=1 Tax=Intoshia linei TaxID=1819745 RepID=A0A177B6P5_9BILA|nr:hypothetical protein A3Q56_02302 [Intoshia linei]